MIDILLLSKQVERVKRLWTTLAPAQRILLGTHEHPDGDALGSVLALTHAFQQQNKQVTAFIPTPAPPFFQFLPGFTSLTTTKPSAKNYDAIILLDYTELSRTSLKDEFLSHPLSITIDHHYSNPGHGTDSFVIPQAAATTQVLAEMLAIGNLPLTADIATCLLTGIFTDTGSFMHDSTSPHILKLAAELMKKGARLSHIAHETYQKKDLPSLCIWGKALSRILVNEHTGAAISLVTPQDLQSCQATLDDLSGVVNLLNALPQAKFAMLLVEYEKGKIKGSLRSESHKGVDVSRLAKALGGGGHQLAAGFEVSGHLVQEEGMWRIRAY